jgi:hypothetical protein
MAENRVRDAIAPAAEIRVDEVGAWHYRGKRLLGGVRWAEVTAVAVGKLDSVTYDPICISLQYGRDASFGEAFLELTPGFETFAAEVERRFGIDPAWRVRVNEGTFKQNWEILWRKVIG